ncbi:helix-turn-helix transcriptional regulator [Streptomyces sp. NPDC001941]|uniref:helix-turn-helix transcriptional regulator n=1 Tax=Streptomyces sp. NPDC001941 TaxID=3154659 RepID=UPI0033179BEE
MFQLLRGWRERAARRRGQVLSQLEVASMMGRSERWYRELERGHLQRFDARLFASLADALHLTADERLVLHFPVTGGTPWCVESPGLEEVSGWLRSFLRER